MVTPFLCYNCRVASITSFHNIKLHKNIFLSSLYLHKIIAVCLINEGNLGAHRRRRSLVNPHRNDLSQSLPFCPNFPPFSTPLPLQFSPFATTELKAIEQVGGQQTNEWEKSHLKGRHTA